MTTVATKETAMNLKPYTHEELRAKIPQFKAAMATMTSDLDYEVRPMPLMSYEEVKEALNNLVGLAHTRPLTEQECFMHGQLCACLETAVRARMLGKTEGRWLVMSEAEVQRSVRLLTEPKAAG